MTEKRNEIMLRGNDKGLSILVKRSIVDGLRGSIKAENKEKIDEIISAGVWDLS